MTSMCVYTDDINVCLLSVVRSQAEQQLNDRLISHSTYVSELMVSDSNLAQNASHYLAWSCLGQTWSFLHEIRLSKWTNLLSHWTSTQSQTTLNNTHTRWQLGLFPFSYMLDPEIHRVVDSDRSIDLHQFLADSIDLVDLSRCKWSTRFWQKVTTRLTNFTCTAQYLQSTRPY